jgi:hypothetical protein
MSDIRIEIKLPLHHAALLGDMAECLCATHEELAHMLVIRGMFELSTQLSEAMWEKLRQSAQNRDTTREKLKLWDKLRADPKQGPFCDNN